MNPWRHLPLRARVALAFALVTAGAMAGLGTFLHLRVGTVLEEQARTILAARMDALERLPEVERDDVVRDLRGESFAQLLDVDGRVLASSPELRGPLLGPNRFPPAGGTATFETTVFLAGEGEQAPAMLRLSRSASGVMVVGTATEDAEEVLDGLRPSSWSAGRWPCSWPPCSGTAWPVPRSGRSSGCGPARPPSPRGARTNDCPFPRCATRCTGSARP